MSFKKSSQSQQLSVNQGRRVRVSRERREAILDEFERSSLSGADFARLHGIKYPTFAGWILKRRKQPTNSQASTAGSADFAEIILEQNNDSKPAWQPHPPGILQVQLPGGAWLQLDGDHTQSQIAAQFLKALQS